MAGRGRAPGRTVRRPSDARPAAWDRAGMQSTRPLEAVRGALVQAARDTGYLTIGLLTSSLALRLDHRAVAVAVARDLRRRPAGRDRLGDRLSLDRRARPPQHGVAAAPPGARELPRARPRPARAADLDARRPADLARPRLARPALGARHRRSASSALGLVAGVPGFASLPAWYWSLPDGADVGIWNADTLLECVRLRRARRAGRGPDRLALRVMALVESRLAESLLGGDDEAMTSTATATDLPRARRFDPHVALSLHFALTALVVAADGADLGRQRRRLLLAGVGLDRRSARAAGAARRRAPRASARRAVQGRSVRVHAEIDGADRRLSDLRLGARGLRRRVLALLAGARAQRPARDPRADRLPRPPATRPASASSPSASTS